MQWLNGPLRAPTPPSAGVSFSDADAAKPAGHPQCALEHPEPVLAWALAPPHAPPSVLFLFFLMVFVGVDVWTKAPPLPSGRHRPALLCDADGRKRPTCSGRERPRSASFPAEHWYPTKLMGQGASVRLDRNQGLCALKRPYRLLINIGFDRRYRRCQPLRSSTFRRLEVAILTIRHRRYVSRIGRYLDPQIGDIGY